MEIQVIGNVEAYSTISVKAQVGGQLTNVYFQEGDYVKKGDLLFTIDPRPFEAAVNQAMANLPATRPRWARPRPTWRATRRRHSTPRPRRRATPSCSRAA